MVTTLTQILVSQEEKILKLALKITIIINKSASELKKQHYMVILKQSFRIFRPLNELRYYQTHFKCNIVVLRS